MPKSLKISAYPEIYFDLFEQVASGNDYVSPPLDPRDSQRIRFDIYGFRRALEAESHPSFRLWSSFNIVVDRKKRAPLRITSEYSTLINSLESTLMAKPPKTSPTPIPQSQDWESLADQTQDSGDVLGGLGFSTKENLED